MAFIEISGSTRLCGIIGDPVEHSFSPAMHNEAFFALGLNYAYVPYRVAKDNLYAAVSAVRALNMVGVNVTVPHKQTVVSYLDEVSPAARLIGAVNTIVNQQGRLVGYNTDGQGFIRSLEKQAGFSPLGVKILILGAGGAARAVSVQLALSGAKIIYIANRTYERAQEIATLIEDNTTCMAKALHWKDSSHLKEIKDIDLIVQTTSIGMYPHIQEVPDCSPDIFHSNQLVCDLIYNPLQTLFLEKAKKCGAEILNGLGMLLYQGALAFELWVGLEPPVNVMEKALRQVI